MRAHVEPLARVAALAAMVAGCGAAKGTSVAATGGATDDAGTLDAMTSDSSLSGDPSRCLAATKSRSSIGCEYWAVDMDGIAAANGGCFVAFVANNSDTNVHFDVRFLDEPADLAAHARIPKGAGKKLTYDAFDPAKGLAPGQVAIIFLAGLASTKPWTPGDFTDPVACPVGPIRTSLAQQSGTGIGTAFHIQSDAPVVAYQMLPYGGGAAAVTGASLLIPTSAWDTNYVAVNAYGGQVSSMNIVASQDDTTVTLLPKVSVVGAGAVPSTPAGSPLVVKLQHGQHLQLTQADELTGSPIESDKPIGLFAGQPCLNVPSHINYCDHAEQSIPPIRAMGSEHVAVIHRDRTAKPENPPWRIVGAVDGTTLTFDPPIAGAPTSANLGDVLEFRSGGVAFVVRSQDDAHPFFLNGYMTGADDVLAAGSEGGYGDADFVRVVPSAQWLSNYVFFTDPTYPETNLVVTRKKGGPDVTLDCAGVLGGWSDVGGGRYEYARVDLVRHDFQPQGGCDNGAHGMRSSGPFGLTIWGWGTPETSTYTSYVSYGYPAGENLAPLNTVYVPARPK